MLARQGLHNRRRPLAGKREILIVAPFPVGMADHEDPRLRVRLQLGGNRRKGGCGIGMQAGAVIIEQDAIENHMPGAGDVRPDLLRRDDLEPVTHRTRFDHLREEPVVPSPTSSWR